MKKILYFLFIIVFIVLSVSAYVSAQTDLQKDKSGTQQEKSSVVNRAKGVGDVLLSWSEVVTTPAKGAEKYGAVGFLGGLIISPIKMTLKIVGGLDKISTGKDRKIDEQLSITKNINDKP